MTLIVTLTILSTLLSVMIAPLPLFSLESYLKSTARRLINGMTLRFVDETAVILEKEDRDELRHHIVQM